MRDFATYITTQQFPVGGLRRLGYMVCTPHETGNASTPTPPKFACVSAAIDWGNFGGTVTNAAVGVAINLVGSGPQSSIKRVEAVYIDNTFNPLPVYVTFPDTGFCAVGQAYAITMIPVLTNQLNCNVYCQGFDGVTVPSTRVVLMEKHVDVFNIAPPTDVVVTPPSIRSSSNGNNGAGLTTTTNVTIPAGIVAGDELLMVFGMIGGGGLTVTTPAGWTLKQAASQISGFSRTYMNVFSRTADGTEVNFAVTHGSSLTSWGMICSKDTTEGPEAAGIVTAGPGATSITPPVLAPSWGQSLDLSFVACISGGVNITATPAGYAVLITQNGGSASAARLSIVWLLQDVASIAPGTFTTAGATGILADTIAYR